MGDLGKRIIVAYIASECDRQLFWELGKGDATWINPLQSPKSIQRPPGYTDLLTRIGNVYGKHVYSTLVPLPVTKCKFDSNGDVGTTKADPAYLLSLHATIMASGMMVLLEHELVNPASFVNFLFPPKAGSVKPSPTIEDFRPDVLIVKKYVPAENPRELLPGGTIRIVPPAELTKRLGIRIIDIKNIHESKVGKKQFIEIFYYAYVISFYLKENGLDTNYFVSVDGNGIFPQREIAELASIRTIDDFVRLTIKISWDASQRIFLSTIATIQALWRAAPCSVDSIPLKMSPACAYCYFVEDCKARLGMGTTPAAASWSLDLLPSTPSSTKELLKDLGMKTVGDVQTGIAAVSTGMNPDPLMAEKPLLDLKSNALVLGKMQQASAGTIHSYAIPMFSSMAVTFTCESDPSHDHVYVIALQFDASVATKAPFANAFDDWWTIWEQAIRNQLPLSQIKQRLDQVLPRPIPIEEVEAVNAAMNLLGGISCITLASPSAGTTNPHAKFQFVSAMVSKRLDHVAETELTKRFISEMHAILTLANIIEMRIQFEAKPGWWVGPDLGIFYWGEDQLDNIEMLLERHVNHLIADPVVGPKLEELILWISPSASEVVHPFQHKKIFDLKTFAQLALGLPCVINYTWQDVAKVFSPSFFTNPKFWVPHYDYFDYRYWHEYLDNSDPIDKPKMEAEIIRQIDFKMRTLNIIRYRLQSNARPLISDNSRAISTVTYYSVQLPDTFHAIAHVWFMYARLNGASQEMEADFTRTIFPDRAIGKLDAARISVPNKIVNPITNKFHFIFSIPQDSSNVKMKEGDWVLVIPEEKRDLKINKNAQGWCLHINTMTWIHTTKSFSVETEEESNDPITLYIKEYARSPADTQWYLYPWANDAWSPKLYHEVRKSTDNDGLLQRLDFGTGWLGARLAWLWNIRVKPLLAWPSTWTFKTPEVYLFAPSLLKVPGNPPIKPVILSSLKEAPDPSQKQAINWALHEVISGIQGPPGTGKSQTIVALVNEFYLRKHASESKPTRVLITAYSYAALNVLVDKILNSEDPAGNSTPIAQFQMIYIRTENQDAYPDPRVVDLVRAGRKSWKWNGKPYTITQSNPLESHLKSTCIIFANAHALYFLDDKVTEDFAFDLILVDEASQMPTDYIMASLQFIVKKNITICPRGTNPSALAAGTLLSDDAMIKELDLEKSIDYQHLTKVVIVGDYNQLPPVQPVDIPENLENVLGSLFSYYVLRQKIHNEPLCYNYRSHVDIVEFTEKTGIYPAGILPNPLPGKAFQTLRGNIGAVQQDWLKDVLEPSRVVTTIIHNRKHESSVSMFEAEMAANIVLAFYDMVAPASVSEEELFWEKKVGVVAPHNAQGRLVIRKIYDELTGTSTRQTRLQHPQLMSRLKATVYSVEKFQGSDRELIIASYGISDRDQISAEEEFIYDLNRFNVLTSRAKHKVVVICSKALLSFIPSDRNVMGYAEKLHFYAFQFCNNSSTLFPTNELGGIESVEFRWHSKGNGITDLINVAASRSGGKVRVSFPLHPRFVKIFKGIPATLQRKMLSSSQGIETWEFDERDLHSFKKYIPVPPAWLR